MPKLSGKVKKEFVDEVFDIMKDTAKNKRLFESFISDLLTPEEIEKIALRWQIVKRLEAGEPQREISRELRVSIGTITRGARMLRNQSGGFKKYLTRK